MATWQLTGSDTDGVIVGEAEQYSFTIENGQVRIRLPFAVDEEHLINQLTEDGWAVGEGEEGMGSQGWGPAEDLDGYYPCWVFPDASMGETVLAFPPKDYHADDLGDHITAATEDVAIDHRPYFGPQSLKEFTRWLPYLKVAAR